MNIEQMIAQSTMANTYRSTPPKYELALGYLSGNSVVPGYLPNNKLYEGKKENPIAKMKDTYQKISDYVMTNILKQ